MNAIDLLETVGSIRDKYIQEAHAEHPRKMYSPRRPLLIAALIALMLLLVGCTIAYASGWFVSYFQRKTGTPLTGEQIRYIEENEQHIGQTQTHNGWTVELHSAITDGETGYILFGITAPADVDLEGTNFDDPFDAEYIVPGNESRDPQGRRSIIVASNGPADQELNYIWQAGSCWQEDNDGLPNTLDYLITIRCEKLFPDKERLLQHPFGKDITFNIRFDDFTLEYEDPEVRAALDAKYAGQEEYLIGGEEMAGLHISQLLVEGEWEFTVVFDPTGDPVELLTTPVTVEAKVHRKLDNGTMFYDTVHGLEPIRITSFLLTPLGAELTYEPEEDIIGVFFQWTQTYGYEDRFISVVLKDGSRIPLQTDSVGTRLKAESPIVLSEADHILMGDGTVIPVP